VRRVLKELESAGYVHRQRRQDANGKWAWDSTIYDVPCDPIAPSTDRSTVDGSAVDGSTSDGPAGDIHTTDIRAYEERTADRRRAPRTRAHDPDSVQSSRPQAPPWSDDDDLAPMDRLVQRIAIAIDNGKVEHERAYVRTALAEAGASTSDRQIDSVLDAAHQRITLTHQARQAEREYRDRLSANGEAARAAAHLRELADHSPDATAAAKLRAQAERCVVPNAEAIE